MTKKKITRGDDLLRERVDKIKQSRPNHYKQLLIAKYPEYDSLEGATLIENVMKRRSLDYILIERLEEVIRQYFDNEENSKPALGNQNSEP